MDNPAMAPTTFSQSFDHLPLLNRGLLKLLNKIKHGRLIVHMNNETFLFGNDESRVAHMHIHQPVKMAIKCITKGDLGFAESYLEGYWTSDDVTQLLTLFLKNRDNLGKSYGGFSPLRITTNLYHKLRKNSLSGSRKNIEYHYDLGNDFYELWLDESMTYSSALYKSADNSGEAQTLFDAQNNKYQRILNELEANDGETILEVGCGWGGFAEAVAANGNTVHGITLSREQLRFAKRRLFNHRDKTHLEIRDYRNVHEKYDHIVSIEMFEAVGEDYWKTYFEMLKRSLKPNGKIVLQIITIKDEFYDLYQKRADFIQRYIFPGGMLPSETILSDLVKENGLKEVNKINFGHDYGKTLARWEKNFNTVVPTLETMGYDEKFQRMWRYYLAYCQAGFEEERIDVVQITLKHAD